MNFLLRTLKKWRRGKFVFARDADIDRELNDKVWLLQCFFFEIVRQYHVYVHFWCFRVFFALHR